MDTLRDLLCFGVAKYWPNLTIPARVTSLPQENLIILMAGRPYCVNIYESNFTVLPIKHSKNRTFGNTWVDTFIHI